MRSYKQFKEKLLRDKEVKKSYEALKPEFKKAVNAMNLELKISLVEKQ